MSKDLSEEYERLVNPEKALEDSKPPRIKEEPMSDISFPVSEEPEADLASGDQALPMGVLGAHGERLASGLDGDHSPHTSGETSISVQGIMIKASVFSVHQCGEIKGTASSALLSGNHLVFQSTGSFHPSRYRTYRIRLQISRLID